MHEHSPSSLPLQVHKNYRCSFEVSLQPWSALTDILYGVFYDAGALDLGFVVPQSLAFFTLLLFEGLVYNTYEYSKKKNKKKKKQLLT